MLADKLNIIYKANNCNISQISGHNLSSMIITLPFRYYLHIHYNMKLKNIRTFIYKFTQKHGLKETISKLKV